MNKQNINFNEQNQQRITGISALKSNIDAAKAISELIKTTLGPMGMDKMLIDELGNIVITNDGVKILKEMQVEHPTAKMIVDVAKTQDNEVGDGTTSVVILTGAILEKAQNLILKKIHPTQIIRTNKILQKQVLKILEENSRKIDLKDKQEFLKVISTTVMGKTAEISKEKIVSLLYDFIKLQKQKINLKDKIKIIKAIGGEFEDSKSINGIILEKEFTTQRFLFNNKNSKILLLDFPLELKESQNDTKLNLNSYKDYENFVENERNYLLKIVDKIKEIKPDIVISQKSIDELISYELEKVNIKTIKRTRISDIKNLGKLLDIQIINSIEDIKIENISKSVYVFEKKYNKTNYIFIESKNFSFLTIFLRGSTNHIILEIERAFLDIIGNLNSLFQEDKVVGGAGAIEIEIYKSLVDFSKKFLNGKNILIGEEFAKSFLSIPQTLCANSGFDEIDMLNQAIGFHQKGFKFCGIDSFTGISKDVFEKGIFEPILIKIQALKSIIETSSMILKIDDIIASNPLKNQNEYK